MQRRPSSPDNPVGSFPGAGYGSYGYGGNSATAGYSKCVISLGLSLGRSCSVVPMPELGQGGPHPSSVIRSGGPQGPYPPRPAKV